jgi:hypothetical protein
MRRNLVTFSVVVAIAAGIDFYAAGEPAPVQSYATVRAEYRTSEKQLLEASRLDGDRGYLPGHPKGRGAR